ncbi:MAG: stage II sporulation protein M [Candidatus Bathyarchaeia archaeon]
MNSEFWRSLPPLIKRIITIFIIFVFAVAMTTAGTLTPVEKQEAEELNKELEETITFLKEHDSLLQFIFGNNFMLALIMFTPFIGPVFGGYVLYNTGYVIAANAAIEGYNPTLGFLLLLILMPFAWLEFAAYSAAMAESLWLTYRIFQGKGKRELVNVAKFIAVCAVILLVAAIIETALIYLSSSQNGASNGSYF